MNNNEKGLSIFDILDKRKVCYAVLRADVSFKIRTVGSRKDYFIVIAKKDKHKVKGLNFISYSDKRILEMTLSKSEITDFYEIKHNFIVAMKDSAGTVFELKSKSFKKHMKHELQKKKRSWHLVNKETTKTHKFETIEALKIKCESIILEKITDKYQILYYQDNILEDDAIIEDYFDVDNFQSN